MDNLLIYISLSVCFGWGGGYQGREGGEEPGGLRGKSELVYGEAHQFFCFFFFPQKTISSSHASSTLISFFFFAPSLLLYYHYARSTRFQGCVTRSVQLLLCRCLLSVVGGFFSRPPSPSPFFAGASGQRFQSFTALLARACVMLFWGICVFRSTWARPSVCVCVCWVTYWMIPLGFARTCGS